MKVVANWKEFAVSKDINSLENDLKNNGWLDEIGNLVLVDESGTDYTKEFWQRYDVAFDDKILDI